MENTKVYFDNAATTKVDERVIEKMIPFFKEHYANASSLHSYGVNVKEHLESARQIIKDSVNMKNGKVIFTSGGTESNNLALKGVAFANNSRGRHIIVSSIEHDCILNTCEWLKTVGFTVTYLPVDVYGMIDLEQLENSIIPGETILVSVMHANNEIGTIQPISEIGEICRKKNIYFHSDACQSYGKTQIDMQSQNIDLLTINSHKIYGPKGIGAILIREGVNIDPILHGGGHEYGLRSSTENIPGIIGFSEAVKICLEEINEEEQRLKSLRDSIIDNVLSEIPFAYLNGHREKRICNNINLAFHGYEGEGIRLLLYLDEIGYLVSSGSACSANDVGNKPSHVLRAIGRNLFEARGALRISLGRFNTEDEVKNFIDDFPRAVRNLSSISSY
jgi:cysteine desulfurase